MPSLGGHSGLVGAMDADGEGLVCHTCTYLNPPGSLACEMCGSALHAPGASAEEPGLLSSLAADMSAPDLLSSISAAEAGGGIDTTVPTTTALPGILSLGAQAAASARSVVVVDDAELVRSSGAQISAAAAPATAGEAGECCILVVFGRYQLNQSVCACVLILWWAFAAP